MLSKTCRILSVCALSFLMSDVVAQPADANYDEAKAGDYKLPDPLVMENGDAVKDAKSWKEKRRR